MKRIILASAFVLCVSALSAQAPQSYRITLSDNGADRFALPQTTVKVIISAEKETFKSGPYARYAQKYLGQVAQLSDRQTAKITDVRLDYIDPEKPYFYNPTEMYGPAWDYYNAAPVNDNFEKLSVDKTSSGVRSAEEMAKSAADMIFMLRKRRIELITGDIGENAFGGGMESALRELDRLEKEYLALFFGTTNKEKQQEVYDVVPTADKNSFIICRFSDQGGLLPGSDLTGEPVVLITQPEKKVQAKPRKDSKNTSLYLVADPTECKVVYSNEELAKSTFAIYQYGAVVAAAN